MLRALNLSFRTRVEHFHILNRINLFWQELDVFLLAPVLTLCLFGMAAVFWAGLSPQFSSPYSLLKQKASFTLGGLVLAVIISQIDYHLYEDRRLQIGASVAIIGFLSLLFLFAPSEFGANLRFMILNKTIQPTEYAKVIIVVVLSYTITETYGKDAFAYFALSIHSLIIGILVVLVALQPDYGAVLILMGGSLSMLVVARLQAGRSAITIGVVVVVSGLLFLTFYAVFRDESYVLQRFRIFADCFFVADCHEYQLRHAYDAIVSGGLFGSTMTDAIHPHGILPMECNDFIFCVIAEELGFLGVALLLLVFALFVQRGIFVSRHCKDFFGQVMAFGLTAMIALQALVNVLVATGLFPITGITLPFISHGGNSQLACMIAVGILLNISKNRSTV